MNVQHNCSKHKCGIKKTKVVCQEQEDTTILAPTIQHEHPKDILLNLAQMRNSFHFESFCVSIPQIDREWAILQGAAREIQSRNEKKTKNSRRTLSTNQSTASTPSGASAQTGGSGDNMFVSASRRNQVNGPGRTGSLLRNLLSARTQFQEPVLGAPMISY